MRFQLFKGREFRIIWVFSFSMLRHVHTLHSLSNKFAILKYWEMFFPFWHDSGLQKMAPSLLRRLEIFCTFCTRLYYREIWEMLQPCVTSHTTHAHSCLGTLPCVQRIWCPVASPGLTWAARNKLHLRPYSVFRWAQ